MSKPLRVLMVEDSENDAILALEQLREGGYEPTCRRVDTLDELRAALEGASWDVILCDYYLPRLNALEALQLLRELDRDIPFILVSGAVGEETAVAAMKAGAHDYIMKDNLTRLVPAVEREIEEAQQRAARRQAEAQYRNLAERLHAVIEAADQLIVCSDVDSLLRSAVELAREKLGLERCSIFIESEDGEHILGTYGTDLEGRTVDEHGYRASKREWGAQFEILAPGEPRWYCYDDQIHYAWDGSRFVPVGRGWVAVTPIQSRRNPVGVLFNDTAITHAPCDESQQEAVAVFASILGSLADLKRTEQTLRDNEQRYRDLVELSPEAIVVHQEGRIVFVNPTALEMAAAQRPEEMVGHPITEFIHPEFQPLLLQRIQRMLETGETATPIEAKFVRKDGSVLLGRVTSRAFSYDGKPAIQTVIWDVTEQKRMEEALRESEQRYRELFENANDVVYTHDLEGNFTSVNQRIMAVAGYTVEEFLKMNIADILPPEQLPIARQMIRQKLEEGKPTTYEIEVLAKDGRRVPAEVSTRLIYRQGKPVGVEGIARDITERKRIEEEKRRLQRQVQQQERLAAVGQLAAGIAHDFNNMLTGIMGYAELLLMNDAMPERFQRELNIILEQGRRAERLIRQILDFSRKSISEQRPLNLFSFLKENVRLLERTIPEDVHIRLYAEPGEYPVRADPTQIQHVMTNLAVNAKDAMPNGGDLSIHLEKVSFSDEEPKPFAQMPAGDWVHLTVADTGHGMRPEVLERIYEPFFTTKEVGEGTGLGLSQVYGIVKQHRGFISAESEVGRGSTFHIYLPLLEELPGRAEVKAEERLPRGQGETILVVEDEPIVLEACKNMLRVLGYEVLTATDGQAAIRVYQEHRDRITLILSDMVMPEMGGMALYQALKQESPDVKMVITTGYPLREESHALLAQGIVSWIQKPFRLHELAHVVRQAIDGT